MLKLHSYTQLLWLLVLLLFSNIAQAQNQKDTSIVRYRPGLSVGYKLSPISANFEESTRYNFNYPEVTLRPEFKSSNLHTYSVRFTNQLLVKRWQFDFNLGLSITSTQNKLRSFSSDYSGEFHEKKLEDESTIQRKIGSIQASVIIKRLIGIGRFDLSLGLGLGLANPISGMNPNNQDSRFNLYNLGGAKIAALSYTNIEAKGLNNPIPKLALGFQIPMPKYNRLIFKFEYGFASAINYETVITFEDKNGNRSKFTYPLWGRRTEGTFRSALDFSVAFVFGRE